MGKEDAFKILYSLVWILIASYYYWGAKEESVTAPIDESGWVPDGAFASQVSQAADDGAAAAMD